MCFAGPPFLSPDLLAAARSGLQTSGGWRILARMLNYIWLGLVVSAVLLGGATGRLDAVVKGGFDMARAAVMDIALPLSAIIALWLGLMRLAEKAGLVRLLSRALRPALVRLFPDVPPEHPAMGSIVMNIAANMLGLGNAATPLGLRAMGELQKLNPFPSSASNAMCVFLTINTASIQLIPITAIALLTNAGGKNPTGIIGTALLATVCAQAAGLISVKFLERLPIFRPQPEPESAEAAQAPLPVPAAPPEAPARLERPAFWKIVALALFLACFTIMFCYSAFGDFLAHSHQGESLVKAVFTSGVKALSLLAVPFFLSFFPFYAAMRGVKVYEEFVEGAKEGFGVAVRIIPYLVAILVAVGMFRGANGMELVARALKPVLDVCGFPTELLPLAIMRPLSGSGSIALVSDIIKNHGADSLLSMMAATILGSTETTFYVLAVYFGSVGIRRTRHAVAAGLIADAVGIIAAVAICKWMFAS